MRQPATYILTNRKNGTLYTGVTSNLISRIAQHKSATTPGFTTRYGCEISSGTSCTPPWSALSCAKNKSKPVPGSKKSR